MEIIINTTNTIINPTNEENKENKTNKTNKDDFILVVSYRDNEDDNSWLYVLRTPEHEIEFSQTELQDISINGDLSFMFDIQKMIEEAYNAGKEGRKLIIEEVKS